jgi:hypothetical protein
LEKFRIQIRDWIKTIFSKDFKKGDKSCPFYCRKQNRFSESWPLPLDFLNTFFTFLFQFTLDPNSNQFPKPDPEPECITVPVSQKQKLRFLWFPVPQHWLQHAYLSHHTYLNIVQQLKLVTQIKTTR